MQDLVLSERIVLKGFLRDRIGLWLDCCGTGQGQVVELLWMRQWTFGLHTMRGISWLAEKLSASQAALCNHLKGSVCRRTVGTRCTRLYISISLPFPSHSPSNTALYWPLTSAFPLQIVSHQPVCPSALCDILSYRYRSAGSPNQSCYS